MISFTGLLRYEQLQVFVWVWNLEKICCLTEHSPFSVSHTRREGSFLLSLHCIFSSPPSTSRLSLVSTMETNEYVRNLLPYPDTQNPADIQYGRHHLIPVGPTRNQASLSTRAVVIDAQQPFPIMCPPTLHQQSSHPRPSAVSVPDGPAQVSNMPHRTGSGFEHVPVSSQAHIHFYPAHQQWQ